MGRLPALRILLAAAPAYCTAAVFLFPSPVLARVIVGVVVTATLWSPAAGLLLAAALAPIGRVLTLVCDVGPFRLSEATVVAFVAAWLVRPAQSGKGGPTIPGPMAAAAWLLAATVVASIVGVGYQLRSQPDEIARMLNLATHAYYQYQDPIGLTDGARLLEGLALVAAVIGLFRVRPSLAVRLPAALTAAGVVAAAFTVLVWSGVVPGALSAWQVMKEDTGSYFALILCVALGMSARAQGSRRALWAGTTLACGVGLWLSFSRSAVAACAIAIVIAAAWALTARRPPPIRALVMVMGLLWSLLCAALVVAGPRRIAAQNNFRQIATETGLLGLGLFAVWAGGGLIIAARAVFRAPHDYRLVGTVAGVVAFVGTCLTGLPLLVPDVALPFWMVFGLMVALAGSALLDLAVEDERRPALASADVAGHFGTQPRAR